MNHEAFGGDSSGEVILTRLKRLSSNILCKKLLYRKLEETNTELSNDLIERKSVGLASSIDSALGFLNDRDKSLNSAVLSRYYFLLQLTVAEQVSSIKNQHTLEIIEKYTKRGHGIKAEAAEADNFPSNFYSRFNSVGYFPHYLEFLGIDVGNYIPGNNKNPKLTETNDQKFFVSILDLFRRIPELGSVIYEYTGEHPLTFTLSFNQIHNGKHKFLINAYGVPPEFINTLNIDLFANYITIPNSQIRMSNKGNVSGWATDLSQNDIGLYRSAISRINQGIFIVPLYDSIKDHIALHFLLLYNLSIIVRYFPSLWYRIEKGDLNHYSSLIEYYLYTFDQVVPLSILQRITDTRIVVGNPFKIQS